MTPDRDRLFESLEPPPGGTARFRRRLENARRPSRMPYERYVSVGLAAALLAIVVASVVRQPGSPEAQTESLYEAREFARLLGRSTERSDLSVSIDDEPVAVTTVPSADSKIRIYEFERE